MNTEKLLNSYLNLLEVYIASLLDPLVYFLKVSQQFMVSTDVNIY